MIIKILSNKGFSAFGYNNNKIEKGQAEITVIQNFEANTLGIVGKLNASQYYDMLKYQDGLRNDAKSTQIHIVISSHKREDDKERLTQCAKEYMEKMGYGSQPYIVYFHKDTRNNHVHIVSTRVKLDRTIISDSNDKTRSVKICREFNHRYGHTMAENVQQQFRLDVQQALQWTFPDEKSFASLMETFGYKSNIINPPNKNIIFIKDGSVCGKVSKDDLIPNISLYNEGISFRKNKNLDKEDRSPIFNRKQLIYTKMTKYNSRGYTLREIEKLEEFRKQLGLKLHIISRIDKEGKRHFAWMCQDFVSKTFFKGSDIMNLDGFSLQPDIEVKTELFKTVAPELMLNNEQQPLPWRQARKQLRNVGYELLMYKGRARVRVMNTNQLFDIPPQITKAMMRAQRIADVKALPIHSVAEGRVLAMLNYVSYKEIEPEQFAPVDHAVKAEQACVINSILSNGTENLSAKLQEENIHVVVSGEDIYFLDGKKAILYPASEIDVPLTLEDIENRKIKFISMDYLSANYERWTRLGEEEDLKQLQNESQVLSSKKPFDSDAQYEEFKDRSRRGNEPFEGESLSPIGDVHTRTNQSVNLFDVLIDLSMGLGQNLAAYQRSAQPSKKDRKKRDRTER